MAVRLYLQNAAAPYTPTTVRGTWDNAGATGASYLGPRPAGVAATAAIAVGSVTASWDVVLRRFVSDPLVAGGSLGGVVTWIFGVLESNAAANAFVHLHIYVTVGDSDTVRGTLLSDYVDTGTEWTVTGTGRGVGPVSITTTAVQAGDRIVAVVGYRASSDTTARTATLNYGNAGVADLAQGGTGVTTAPGWIEFSGGDGIIYTSLSSLTSQFATMPAFFSGNYGSIPPAVVGGRLQVSSDGTYAPGGTPTDDYSGAITNNTETFIHFDTAGVYVEVPTLPSNTGATTYSYASLQIIDADNPLDGTLCGITLNTKSATATFYIYSAYSDSGGGVTSLALDTTNHRWLRIRRSGASLLWDTSPDNATWTNRRTLATPASWVNYNKLDLLLECFKDDGAASFAEYDNLNSPAATSATATPGTVAAAAAVPAPAISTSVTVAAPVVAATVAVPAPQPRTGSTASPPVVTAVAAVPAPAVAVATSANVNAPVVAAAAAVPAPQARTGSTAAAPSVAATAAVPVPGVSGSALVLSASVPATVAVPAAVPRTGSTAAAPSIAAVVAVPAPMLGAVTVVAPAVVAASTSVPVPALSTGSRATPPVIAAAVAIPPASVSTGADTGVAAPVVQASVAVPPPSLVTSSQIAAPVVAATSTVPPPTLFAAGNATVFAARVAAAAAVSAPGISAGARATPAVVAAAAAVPAPVVSGRVTVAAATVAAVATVLAPALSAAVLVATPTVAVTVAFPQVRVRRTTGGTFATTTETGTFTSTSSAGRFG